MTSEQYLKLSNRTAEPSIEYQLLLLSARTVVSDDCANKIVKISREAIDWNELILLARVHGLAPLLFKSLSDLNCNVVPDEALERLKTLHEAFRCRNLILRTELMAILQILEEGSVLAVAYKGPALAEALYGDIALRQFSDLDILIRPTDVLRARRILLKEGYKSLEKIPTRKESWYARFHCGFSYQSNLKNVVEVNWRIAPRYWRFPEIWDSIWERLGSLKIAGRQIPWFTPEDQLLILCLHGNKHKWDQLKWVVDIAELIRCNPNLNWQRLFNEAREQSMDRMLNISLVLAHTLLDAELPDFLHQNISRDTPSLKLAASIQDSLFSNKAVYKKPPTTIHALPFLIKASQSIEMKLFCSGLIPAYFVLHSLIRPTLALINRRTTDLSEPCI